MGRCVIVAYLPKPGKQAILKAAVKDHLKILTEQGLITDQPGCLMRAEDETIIEVFEWKSAEAISQAHSNPAVLSLWDRSLRAAATPTWLI